MQYRAGLFRGAAILGGESFKNIFMRFKMIDNNVLKLILPILFKPRATINDILPKKSNILIFTITFINGMLNALISPYGFQLTAKSPIISILIIGPISSIIALYISGFLGSWCGTVFDGDASQSDIRAVIAYSSIPFSLFALLITIINLFIYRENYFNLIYRQSINDPLISVIAITLNLLTFIFGIWYTIIITIWFSEVHKFSIAKAIGTIALSLFLIIGPIIAVILIIK
jgi:hypothetical protein